MPGAICTLPRTVCVTHQKKSDPSDSEAISSSGWGGVGWGGLSVSISPVSGDLHGLVRSSENACEHDRVDMRHQPTQFLELLVHRHAVGDGGDEPVGVLLALVLEGVAAIALWRTQYGTADDVVFVLLLHNT